MWMNPRKISRGKVFAICCLGPNRFGKSIKGSGRVCEHDKSACFSFADFY